MTTEPTTPAPPTAPGVPCRGLFRSPHAPHDWVPQPGMDPARCPGVSGVGVFIGRKQLPTGEPGTVPAPSCTWPDCLTDAQQVELAAQVGAAMGGEATTPMPDQRAVCGCREPAPDLGPAELTAEEARAEVDRLSLDLYRVGDALLFAREMCDHAEDGGLAEVPIARVREWLEGVKCGRQIMAERGRSIVDVAVGPVRCSCGGQGITHLHSDGHRPLPAPSAGRDMMRAAIAGALRAAAYHCDGDCGLDEPACVTAHAIRVDAWAHGVVSDISGPVDALADAVMAAVGAGDPEHAAACSSEPATGLNDGGLRERYADAIDTVFEQWTTGLGETRPQDALTDAVLAVRNGEMERLRAETEALKAAVQSTAADAMAHRFCNMRLFKQVRRAEAAEQILRDLVRLTDVTHGNALLSGHDTIGAGLTCAGCAIAECARQHLTAPREPAGQGDGGGTK